MLVELILAACTECGTSTTVVGLVAYVFRDPEFVINYCMAE